MKKILVLGAGHSAPFLIRYLLDQAEALDAQLTVADLDRDNAARRLDDHPRGRAIGFDVHDDEARRREIAAADVVVHLLPPALQALVAEECVAQGTHMVSASYRSRAVKALDDEASRRGVALVCELGLDPGIDIMSAERIIGRVRAAGGVVERFASYGGGLPEPGAQLNPLDYCVTWNPRNVVMAAHTGACFLRRGQVHLVPWERVFATYWTLDVPGLGCLEAYANRDSLTYRDVHGLKSAHTLVRGTLRYPGWCEFWRRMVRLGLPNEELEIPDFAEHTWSELIEMFLPDPHVSHDGGGPPSSPETKTGARDRVLSFLDLDAGNETMKKLEWLGIFSGERLRGHTPAAALVALFEEKLKLPPTARDLVVLHHELDVGYGDGRGERIRSTFVSFGEAGGMTAMARGVGLPAALAVKLLLEGRLQVRGALIPTHPEIYQPILDALEGEGMVFREQVEPLSAAARRCSPPSDAL